MYFVALIDLYTGMKATFPHLRTAATIGWDTNISQMQLPLDLWVDHYVNFFEHGWRANDRLHWLSQGKEYMWYWSDDPWDVRKLNPSWIEWPAIHGRLLFWLASLHGVPGMLYWVTDLWAGACHGNTTTPSCDMLSCSEPHASGWSYLPLNHTVQGEGKRIMLKHNGECATVQGCSSCTCHTKTVPGAKLMMGKCCSGPGVPAYVANCSYWLKPAHYDGKHDWCYACGCPANQQWDFNHTDRTLRSVGSGLCITVVGDGNVEQQPCGGEDFELGAQQWLLTPGGKLINGPVGRGSTLFPSQGGESCLGNGSVIPTGGKCNPISRKIDSRTKLEAMFTDWHYSPAMAGPNGQNGDGSLFYPSTAGGLASVRLVNIRGGIEDWELFNRLGYSSERISNAADLIRRTVVNATNHTQDPLLLEQLRRHAAHRVIELRQSDVVAQ